MNIIFVGKNPGQSRSLHVSIGVVACAFVLSAAVIGGAGWAGYRLASKAPEPVAYGASAPLVKSWESRLGEQQAQLQHVRQTAGQQVDALTLRLGQMQGRLLRLDALGQRLVESAHLDNGEFDFDQAPAVGGPEEAGGGESFQTPELSAMIDQLDARISNREQQLRLLDQLLSRERIEEERFVAGRPIKWGWLSSHYGYRTDPFTGKRAWHSGVDLAGKEGSDIISVAAGVVTWAGDRYGYGNLVEIDHGNGLRTRYAHCKKVDVSVGDVVEKGQVVAQMGSTGRSTGPHVHFEVRRNGKTLDPEDYIQRASR
ncbi:M23 family metallopeptidase [Marinobacter sp. R17]|uniref:M23 family metallopeptidase n=1 Tax=Marinobacter TaxID=2742 RepID=UPI000F4B5F34|nr:MULTISPECIES: M23 family metallopeptidase [Marinobacter]ROT96225.1 M23 family metallopeptidase [Marinobacter sp. R17]